MPHMTAEDFELPRAARGGLGDSDRCDVCSSQYAYLSAPGKPGTPGRTILGCGTCGRPAPDDHPEQQKLKRDWDAREARDKAALHQSQKEAAAASASPHRATTTLGAMEDRFVELTRRLDEQAGKIGLLETQVQLLTSRRK